MEDLYLSQAQQERLDPEEYSEFLAYGDPRRPLEVDDDLISDVLFTLAGG